MALAAVATRLTTPPPAPPANFRCDREQAGRARRYVRERCEELGRGDLADDCVIVAGELFANAVSAQLAQIITTDIRVAVAPERGSVVIRVFDHAAGYPTKKPVGELDEQGRGLNLVEELTGGAWGWSPWGPGKFVAARLGRIHR